MERAASKISKTGILGRIAAVALLVVLLSTVYLTARGLSLCQAALSTESLDAMAASIKEQPSFVSLDDLPDLYLQSVVAVEDHRFYTHPGIDAIACLRALVHNIQAGAIVEGGSTITQQLAKNQYFSQDQTLERKVAETFMAMRLEQRFSKRELLELYVNSIYFGEGLYGVGAASQGYFGKDAGRLDGYESTLLAGVPNAPSAYAPSEDTVLVHERQRQVVDKLVSYGYLDEVDAQRILDEQGGSGASGSVPVS